MDVTTVINALATTGPMAVVLGFALYTVWGKYQSALLDRKTLQEKYAEEIKALLREVLDVAHGGE